MRGTTAIGVLLTMTLLVGCGEEKKDDSAPKPNGIAEMSVRDALAAADKAMSKLSDATYKAEGTDENLGAFDAVDAMVRGGACQATLRSEKKGTLTIRTFRNEKYVRVDELAARRFYGFPKAATHLIEDKWVKPKGKPPGFADCALGSVVPPPRYYGSFVATGLTKVDGREARAFRGRNATGPLELWIATTGKPVVLALAHREGGIRFEFRVTLFDTGLELKRPDSDEVIPLP